MYWYYSLHLLRGVEIKFRVIPLETGIPSTQYWNTTCVVNNFALYLYSRQCKELWEDFYFILFTVELHLICGFKVRSSNFQVPFCEFVPDHSPERKVPTVHLRNVLNFKFRMPHRRGLTFFSKKFKKWECTCRLQIGLNTTSVSVTKIKIIATLKLDQL